MVNLKVIEEAVYKLCTDANTKLNDDVTAKIIDAYKNETNNNAKQALGLILKNAKLAKEKKMPLCQDTGQVLVFIRGQNIPSNIKELIDDTVEKAYEENFFRKSVVKDALFERQNTKTNTPCIIYTEITDDEDIEIELLIKGGGSENVCSLQMMSPTSTEEDIINYVTSTVKDAGSKACPPYFLGIGIGGTMDYAALLSKKALLLDNNIDEDHHNLAEKIKESVNSLEIGAAGYGGASTVLDVKIMSDFTHIACMPVAVTINCHSSRHLKCKIKNDKIVYKEPTILDSFSTEEENYSDFIKVDSSDRAKLKSLKKGDKVLLSGEIYTARDMAHKKLIEMMEKEEQLPFDLKNKIIFYAGPCPCSGDCVIGSIGPTTASRMDKFAQKMYSSGVLATIGKGERTEEATKAIKENGGLYFSAIGGIACYFSSKFIEREIVAFEELGTEAVFKFRIKDLPLRLEII